MPRHYESLHLASDFSSPMDVIPDSSDAVELICRHRALIENGHILSHLLDVLCPHHAHVDVRIGQHEPVTVNRGQRFFAWGHPSGFQESSPRSGSKRDNPWSSCRFKIGKDLCFRPSVGRIVPHVKNIKNPLSLKLREELSVVTGETHKTDQTFLLEPQSPVDNPLRGTFWEVAQQEDIGIVDAQVFQPQPEKSTCQEWTMGIAQ